MANEVHVYEQIEPGVGDANSVAFTAVTTSRVFIGHVHWVETNGAAATVTIWVRLGGAAKAAAQYRARNLPLAANDADNSLPLHLDASDIIECASDTGDVVFHLSGLEFSYA